MELSSLLQNNGAPPGNDLLDNLIYATIILFILSVITEKLTQLVRMYAGKFRAIAILFCLISYYPIVRSGFLVDIHEEGGAAYLAGIILLFSANTFTLIMVIANTERARRSGFSIKHLSSLQNIHKETKADEKTKEKEVTLLSFIIGFVVAYSFHANFFDLFRNPPEIGWEKVTPLLENQDYALNPEFFSLDLLAATGFVLTAFFLAFGSKFFHDLLDTLFQVKSLKRKLADKQTYEAGSIAELDEYISLTGPDVVHLAISQNNDLLKNKFPEIVFLNPSVAMADNKRKPVAAIYLKSVINPGIPLKIPARLPSGKTVFVETEIITGFDKGKISAGLEGEVANNNSRDYKGSSCCLVKDEGDTIHLVTNCHVLTGGDLQSPLFNTGGDKVRYNNREVGKWHYGSLDNRGDFALVALNDPDDFIRDNEVEPFVNFRELSEQDYFTQVTACGHKCGTKSDVYIIDVVKGSVEIEYNFGLSVTFDEVILVGDKPDKENCQPVSDHGDSGGSLFDADHNLIGIITGKNDRFSFVMPVKKIIETLQLKLYQS